MAISDPPFTIPVADGGPDDLPRAIRRERDAREREEERRRRERAALRELLGGLPPRRAPLRARGQVARGEVRQLPRAHAALLSAVRVVAQDVPDRHLERGLPQRQADVAAVRGEAFMTGFWLGPLGTPVLFDLGVFFVVLGIGTWISFGLLED